MESGIQSSFIPQDAGKATASPKMQRGGGLADLLFLGAIVLFVVSLALAGAVFLYNQYLKTSEAAKIEQLQRAREAFEPALIQQLTRLDDRMRAADSVLSAHIAPTAFFLALQQATLSTISFVSLELDATDPKKVTIKMPGVARSVNSIALQADLMSKNGVFTSPIFSNISRQADGVHFDLTASVNPAVVNYVSLVAGAVRSLTPPTQQPTNPQQSPAQGTPSPFNGSTGDGSTPVQGGGAAQTQPLPPNPTTGPNPATPSTND